MDTTKYVALAFSTPAGLKLRAKVEESWTQWLRHVENAPWLRMFDCSPLLRGQSRARTPEGVVVAGWPRYPSHEIADFAYATAVWGFGVEGRDSEDPYWEREARRHQYKPRANPYGVCGSKTNTGMPLMFKDLDEWLETLWKQC